MAKKNRFTNAARRIGAVVGRAEGTAHKIAKAGVVARKELDQISKQVEGLKRQLEQTAKRLRRAMR